MNRHLKKLISAFNESTDIIEEKLKKCENIHRQFLDRWPQDKLTELLTLQSYVIGKGDSERTLAKLRRVFRLCTTESQNQRCPARI